MSNSTEPSKGSSGSTSKKKRWRVVSPLKRGGVVHKVDEVIELSDEDEQDVPEGVLTPA